MKRSGTETLWILAACVVYFLVYLAIERWFGGEGRWVLVVVAVVAIAAFLVVRRRAGKGD